MPKIDQTVRIPYYGKKYLDFQLDLICTALTNSGHELTSSKLEVR